MSITFINAGIESCGELATRVENGEALYIEETLIKFKADKSFGLFEWKGKPMCTAWRAFKLVTRAQHWWEDLGDGVWCSVTDVGIPVKIVKALEVESGSGMRFICQDGVSHSDAVRLNCGD
jgi:hypothetical protein